MNTETPPTIRIRHAWPLAFLIAWLFAGGAHGTGLVPVTNPVVYSDGRPYPSYRMNATDQGKFLDYGGAPNQTDYRGIREALINQVDGKFYLFYDGAGLNGWLAHLAESTDLVNWTLKGPVLDYGAPGSEDSASASAPWIIKDDNNLWHMFYLGTPNASPAPDYVPYFPYLTMRATATSPAGPWTKHYLPKPFRPQPGTYYSMIGSPGQVIKQGPEYRMFFSSTDAAVKRTLGIARTQDLAGAWTLDASPALPVEEQIENSALYFEPANSTWFLFTNHVGIGGGTEYTDGIWVYWTTDLNTWNPANKAVVLDGSNCTWSSNCIGMPSVTVVGDKLYIFYDAPGGTSTSHMLRSLGKATLQLPLDPTLPPDTTAPAIQSLAPANAGIGVALDTNLVITFNEPVKKGVGDIVLRELTNGAVVETIPVTSELVSVSGAVVTINPANNFAISTRYGVEIGAGAILDTANNPFPGIAANATWIFSTGTYNTTAITVGEHSFEGAKSLSGWTGVGAVPGESIASVPSPWVKSGDAFGSGWTTSGQYSGGIPDGDIYAYANGGTNISQTLATTLQANTAYTLTVAIGWRKDMPGIGYPTFPGYGVEFWAGGVKLASDYDAGHGGTGAASPALDQWRDAVVTCTSPATVTSGQALQIRLIGYGIQTDYDNVRLTATLPPAPPTGLTAAPGDAQVSLSWTASEGAVVYVVSRSTVSGGPYTQVAMTGSTHFVDSGLLYDTTYFYVVSAVAGNATSSPAAEVSCAPLFPDKNGIWSAASGGNWTDATRWQNQAVSRGAGFAATFPLATGGTINQNCAALTIGHLNFSNGNFTINGNPLALDVATGTPTVTVGSGVTATIACVLTGTDGLTKIDSGLLTLSGANTYSGGTTVTGGTVVAGIQAVKGGASALGSSAPANEVTLNNGGVLTGNTYNWLDNTNLAAGGTDAHAVVINQGGTLKGAANYITGLGNVTLNGGTIEVGTGFNNFPDQWNGSFTLGGDITVSGTVASSITTASGAGTSANMQMSDGANNVGGTRTFTVNNVTGDAASDLIVSARLANGTVVKEETGTLELAAGASGNGTAVNWAVNTGTLKVKSGVTTGGITIAPGATLAGSGTVNGPATINGILAIDLNAGGTDTLVVAGNLNITNATLDLSVLSGGITAQEYVIASFGSLTGTQFAGVNGLPAGYRLAYDLVNRVIKLVPTFFTTWIAGYGVSDPTPVGDPDGDGLANVLELVLGGNPAQADPGHAPQVSDNDTSLNFVFQRADASETADITLRVEASTDLFNWNEIYLVGATTATSSDGVGIQENGSAPDAVTVTIPKGTGSAKFVRLRAVVTP